MKRMSTTLIKTVYNSTLDFCNGELTNPKNQTIIYNLAVYNTLKQ